MAAVAWASRSAQASSAIITSSSTPRARMPFFSLESSAFASATDTQTTFESAWAEASCTAASMAFRSYVDTMRWAFESSRLRSAATTMS